MTVAAHGRLPWPERDDLDGDGRAVYHAILGGPRASDAATSPIIAPDGRLEGPFNAMLMSPAVGGALQSLGSAIRYGASLADRDRELAILEVAAHHRSDFEWFAHERLANAAGLEAATLEAIRSRRHPEGLDAGADSVWVAVRALLERGDLDDEEYASLVAARGEPATVELVVLVGYYQTLALMLRTFRVPVPVAADGANTDWSASNREGKS